MAKTQFVVVGGGGLMELIKIIPLTNCRSSNICVLIKINRVSETLYIHSWHSCPITAKYQSIFLFTLKRWFYQKWNICFIKIITLKHIIKMVLLYLISWNILIYFNLVSAVHKYCKKLQWYVCTVYKQFNWYLAGIECI